VVVVEAPGEALQVGLHELPQPRRVARVHPQLLEVELLRVGVGVRVRVRVRVKVKVRV